MRHHDGRVERGEIQGGDWDVVVASLGLDHRRPLEVILARLPRHCRDKQILLHGFADQLGNDLNGREELGTL